MVSRDGNREAVETITEGLKTHVKKSARGKRKAIDDNETDQAPSKRVTRSGNQPNRLSKPKERAALKKGKRGIKAASAKKETEIEKAVAGRVKKTCLQKAWEVYHYRTCGKSWEWLHEQLSPRNREDPDGWPRGSARRFDEHGTILSLLLLDVFDRTLLLRTTEANSHIQPHEIDEMLPLCGGEDLPEQYFPFTYSANIVVPYDILLNLGVNIFREMDFDTWSIQIVLRKLLLNLVPWDKWRRTTQDGEGSSDDRIEDTVETMRLLKPSMSTLAMQCSTTPALHPLMRYGFGMAG